MASILEVILGFLTLALFFVVCVCDGFCLVLELATVNCLDLWVPFAFFNGDGEVGFYEVPLCCCMTDLVRGCLDWETVFLAAVELGILLTFGLTWA